MCDHVIWSCDVTIGCTTAGFVVIDVNHPSCTAMPTTATTVTTTQRPAHLPCSPTMTATATNAIIASTTKLTNQSPPELTLPSVSGNVTASTPQMNKRPSQDSMLHYQSAIVFSEQFVDGKYGGLVNII